MTKHQDHTQRQSLKARRLQELCHGTDTTPEQVNRTLQEVANDRPRLALRLDIKQGAK